MKIKRSLGDHVFDVCNTAFMCFLMLIMLYPMLNVLAISLSSSAKVTQGVVTFYPQELNLEGYQYILKQSQFYVGFRNSVIYAFCSTVFTLLFTSLAAYSLAIKEFVLKKFFTIFLTITMFFGGGMVPTYLLLKDLHMLNTLWVIVLPGCVSAYTVFVFRTFFQGLPGDLRESAYIDGANDLYIWFKITIPLSKPLLATYALFTIVGCWNSWFNALLYLQDESRYPIQMFLRKMVVDGSINSMYQGTEIGALLSSGKVNPRNMQMAVIVLTMLPILCIYPFVQKYFVKGVMIGAIKG